MLPLTQTPERKFQMTKYPAAMTGVILTAGILIGVLATAVVSTMLLKKAIGNNMLQIQSEISYFQSEFEMRIVPKQKEETTPKYFPACKESDGKCV